MTSRGSLRSADTGVREFESGGFRVRVKPRDTWITVKGRGGSLMMSLEEAEDVIAVINCAADYINEDQP